MTLGFEESGSLGVPSITLPSRQFPGLLCFGAGFFNLILGVTLIVSSSLADAGNNINNVFLDYNVYSINTFDRDCPHGKL